MGEIFFFFFTTNYRIYGEYLAKLLYMYVELSYLVLERELIKLLQASRSTCIVGWLAGACKPRQI